MDKDVKIPTREEVHKRLKRHLEVTLEYLAQIEEAGEEIDYGLPIDNWYVHDMVASSSQVAGYFPETLAKKSAYLWKEWSGLFDFCERKAYYDNPYVQTRYFPWFEGMDLNQNLRKTLSFDEMCEYGANATYLYDWVYDKINIAALKDVAFHVRSSKLYGRKKALEEIMIASLEA